MTDMKGGEVVDCSDCLWRVDTMLREESARKKKRPSADTVSAILKRMRGGKPACCCCQHDGDAHTDVQYRFCAMLRAAQQQQ